MATITSPRSSTAPLPPLLPTPSSSRRTSLDTTHSSPSRASTGAGPASSAPVPAQHQRRNRALLRDYYGLKPPPSSAAGADDAPPRTPKDEAQVPHGAPDAEGFAPEAHVRELLAREGLDGVLREGGKLVGEIKTLDGERAALVYDNYARLIAATETIRRMRTHVGGELAATAGAASTLGPTVAHIAGTAEALAGGGAAGSGVSARARARSVGQADKGKGGDQEKEEREVQTVRWVLGAPKRLGSLAEEGKGEEAEEEWGTVRGLLDRWKGVEGVEKVRRDCEEALSRSPEADER